MKLSDYVAQFLVDQGVTVTFVLTGGCIIHIIDSVAKKQGINYLPVHHEQAGAMAADAYARITGKIGVAMATSGPGATNLLTGTCCSYYDSIPVVMITGQVPTSQLKRDSMSRQIGFQETDVVSIFRSVTKYATLVDDPSRIRYELEKAFYLAKNGRPGPVLLDICDDVQRADIDPGTLNSFTPELEEKRHSADLLGDMYKIVKMINEAERPVFIFGGGVRSADAVQFVKPILKTYQLPFTLTWAAMDFLPHDDPLFVGGFGVTSGRPGNFAVQNADLIIAIGTRLDTHEAGSNLKNFAREARKIIVDIDSAEQEKYQKKGMFVDLLITEDAARVMSELIDVASALLKPRNRGQWLNWIQKWKQSYPICLEDYRKQSDKVNPYVFMEVLSELADDDAVVVTDCGSNLIWTMQGFRIKGERRIISAFNHSPMGYSLPASIGVAKASPGRQIICIIGDGGLQINIQELGTIARHNLGIKIFVLNNHSHGIIQGTQDNWLDGSHEASCPQEGGLPDCNVDAIAQAYGLQSESIDANDQLNSIIQRVLQTAGAVVCNVHQRSGAQIYPKLLYGRPIEDSDPLLSRDEFHGNMIVKPVS